MSTNVRTGTFGYPAPMGLLRPGASFATASIPLTFNITPVNNDGTPDTLFQSVAIQASPDNSTYMLVCTSAAPPDMVGFTNVIGFLMPGDWFPSSRGLSNGRNITQFFLAALNDSDFAIASLEAF